MEDENSEITPAAQELPAVREPAQVRGTRFSTQLRAARPSRYSREMNWNGRQNNRRIAERRRKTVLHGLVQELQCEMAGSFYISSRVNLNGVLKAAVKQIRQLKNRLESALENNEEVESEI